MKNNDAIQIMKQDELIKETLGLHAFSKYVTYKENEWDSYKNFITKWEIDNYLYKY